MKVIDLRRKVRASACKFNLWLDDKHHIMLSGEEVFETRDYDNYNIDGIFSTVEFETSACSSDKGTITSFIVFDIVKED